MGRRAGMSCPSLVVEQVAVRRHRAARVVSMVVDSVLQGQAEEGVSEELLHITQGLQQDRSYHSSSSYAFGADKGVIAGIGVGAPVQTGCVVELVFVLHDLADHVLRNLPRGNGQGAKGEGRGEFRLLLQVLQARNTEDGGEEWVPVVDSQEVVFDAIGGNSTFNGSPSSNECPALRLVASVDSLCQGDYTLPLMVSCLIRPNATGSTDTNNKSSSSKPTAEGSQAGAGTLEYTQLGSFSSCLAELLHYGDDAGTQRVHAAGSTSGAHSRFAVGTSDASLPGERATVGGELGPLTWRARAEALARAWAISAGPGQRSAGEGVGRECSLSLAPVYHMALEVKGGGLLFTGSAYVSSRLFCQPQQTLADAMIVSRLSPQSSGELGMASMLQTDPAEVCALFISLFDSVSLSRYLSSIYLSPSL